MEEKENQLKSVTIFALLCTIKIQSIIRLSKLSLVDSLDSLRVIYPPQKKSVNRSN